MNLSSQNYKSCQIFRHVVNVQRSNSLLYTDTTASFFGTHDAPNHYFVLFSALCATCLIGYLLLFSSGKCLRHGRQNPLTRTPIFC